MFQFPIAFLMSSNVHIGKLTNDRALFQMLMYENRMIPMMQYSLK